MRLAVIALLAGLLSACTLIPREEIAAFTSSYQEVDRAARAIYAEFGAREKAALGEPEKIDRFSAAYIFELDKVLEAKGETDAVGLQARLRALDAMLAWNDGLAGLAEGRRFEAVKASLTPLTSIVGTAFGPYGAGAVEALSLVMKGIEAAKTREDLVAVLSEEISVPLEDGTSLTGNPVDLMLVLLQNDVADMQVIVRDHATARFTEMSRKMGRNPDAAELAGRADVVDDAKKFMVALSDYRELLGTTREYFAVLRRAALEQSEILQTAEFVGLAFGLSVEARALIAKL